MENDCVFCDRSKLEERLIYENKDFYVVATIGQITDGGYVLLIPREHIPCVGAFSSKLILSMSKVGHQINRALAIEYKLEQPRDYIWPVTIFEHGIVGQTIKHAHLHYLPTVLNLAQIILRDFPKSRIEELSYATEIPSLFDRNPEPYLYWVRGKEGDSKARVCWNPPAPPQYLRTVAAELLGRPERGNWRNMDPELDKRLCAETVARLKPYFL